MVGIIVLILTSKRLRSFKDILESFLLLQVKRFPVKRFPGKLLGTIGGCIVGSLRVIKPHPVFNLKLPLLKLLPSSELLSPERAA